MWRNTKYIVNWLQHSPYPGVDHLSVERHDGGVDIPWSHLQHIKDALAPDGRSRWAIEVFPPSDGVVDVANMRHLWVMPHGWRSPVDFHDLATFGGVPVPISVSSSRAAWSISSSTC
jgi:hypothetical protein